MKTFKVLTVALALTINLVFVFIAIPAMIKVLHWSYLTVDMFIILEAFSLSYLTSFTVEDK